MDPFLGQIIMFGGNFAPRNWAFCDGQLLPISQNTALFSILGTTYGGDGRTTFALPDLRGRAAMHAGTGPGLSPRRLGEEGGTESNTLSINEMPTHTHIATTNCVGAAGNANTAPGNLWSNDAGNQSGTYSSTTGTTDAMAANAVTLANTGGSIPVNNLQPYQVVNFIIALQGVFPSRS
jgi:microcystin-dependent protein